MARGFTAYRIVRVGLPVFDGTGTFRWGDRWTSPGRYVVHAAESYSLALLENLVHFNLAEIPPHLSAVPLRLPADAPREVLRVADLPGWDARSPYSVSRQHGDRWYDERRTAVLIVPSVLSPFECNVLIHQVHPAARRIEVGDPVPATIDERLRALLGRTRGRRS
jgi:RES domain-containing protein